MASEVQQHRDFLEQSLRESNEASLVDLVAIFDHANHLLPSTWRINQALSQISIPLALSPDRLHLEHAPPGHSAVQLQESDLSFVVATYRKALRARVPTPPQGA